MKILVLALRNLLNNKRRSALTIACIVAGYCMIVTIGGYYEYTYWGIRESSIRSQYAHIQLHARNYLANHVVDPYGSLVEDFEGIEELLKKDSRIEIVTPRIKAWGMISNVEGDSQPVEIRGVDPEKEQMIFTFITSRSGTDLKSDSFDKIQVGKGLADKLKLKVGSEVIITTFDSYGEQNALVLKVSLIMGSFFSEFDNYSVTIPYALASELMGIVDAQEVIVLLNRTEDTAAVTADLRKTLAPHYDLDVTTWKDHNGYYNQVVTLYEGYFRIILIVAVIVAFFTSMNALLMSVFERITEIGTMRSFGFRRKRINSILLVEATAMGLIACVVGLGSSILIEFAIRANGGISMAAAPGMSGGITVFIILTMKNILLASVVAIAVPLIASLFPIAKIHRMSIIDQIRYNS